MVVLSGTLGFVQEARSHAAISALQARLRPRATVIRDGRALELPTEAIVRGDVVVLDAGAIVPADGVLIEANHLYVDESALTGESAPAAKETVGAGTDAGTGAGAEAGTGEGAGAGAGAGTGETPGPARSRVFSGTSVVSGAGLALIERTGTRTAYGAIARRLAERAPETDFQRGIRRFGMLITRVILLLVVGVFAVNVALQRPLIDSLLFAIALAVGLTPELLPAIVTLNLTRGARALAAHDVLVKRLPAIQNLGSMTILCTDKTGTLTEGRLRLEQAIDARGAEASRPLRLAWLNSHLQAGFPNPLDGAIAAALPAPPPEAAGAVKLAELPFDFGRRRLSVLVGRPGEPPLLVTKGAPEVLVPRAGAIRLPDGSTVPLDQAGARQITALAEAAAARGRRSIAVGSRELPAGTAALDLEAESGLVFEGLLVFSDPPRPGVAEVLAELRSRGVELKVITGDHELVARDVARKVGLPVAGVLTGEQMRGLAHEAFVARAERTTIFARVDPDQKLRVVRALRERGAIVGYLGDGINDAPPLHAADVGISVDNATDVARAAADVILLEPDLEDVNRGVIEGRRTFANTLKYIRMGTSSNFGNMLSMAAASLFLPFLPMLPGQILLNNLVYDASQTAIPSDDIDPEAADEPVHWNLPTIERFMITFGPISSVFDFLTFGLLLLVLRADEAAFHTGWFTESLATQVLVVLAIRTSRVPFWRSRPSPLLLAAVLAAVAAAILIPLSPIGPVIGFVVLPPLYWLLLAATVATYLVLVEIVKSRLLGRAGRS